MDAVFVDTLVKEALVETWRVLVTFSKDAFITDTFMMETLTNEALVHYIREQLMFVKHAFCAERLITEAEFMDTFEKEALVDT